MNEDSELQEVLSFKVKDSDLSFLNGMVNKLDFGIGITLFVKGCVITGSLISGRKYYSIVSDNLKASGAVGEALSAYFETKGMDGYTSADPDFEYPNNFLHLENIKIRGGSGVIGSLSDAMLRVKIEEIDGHFIGNIS